MLLWPQYCEHMITHCGFLIIHYYVASVVHAREREREREHVCASVCEQIEALPQTIRFEMSFADTEGA